MARGVQTFNPSTSEVTFDSEYEHVLLLIDEFDVLGSSVGNQGGVTYNYPQYAGKKLVAYMQSPIGDGTIDVMAVLSCRVTGTTVNVFVDNQNTNLPNCDGHLMVFYTGGDV